MDVDQEGDDLHFWANVKLGRGVAMRTLIVLMGMQGAGKTTALANVTGALVLKPSTQRAPRFPGEDEYYFETTWDANAFAWTITRGSFNYGMRNSEIERIETIGITVFDPEHRNVLASSKVYERFEVVTVGLDTLAFLQEQHRRVGNDQDRVLSDAKFQDQRNVIQACDVVLTGSEQVIADALNEIIVLLSGRGGVLSGDSIRKLITAGTLLEGADPQCVESASYDLRLADKYWCQGKYHVLSNESPVAEIPPYSYVLVTAVEQAVLPRFIVGTFDIRVSLFLSGVVLSNGPQVDPGYRGALLCMLSNGSGAPIGLNRGQHFATIQFQTTSLNSKGYTRQYQGRKTFEGFLDGTTAKRPGGTILEDIKSLRDEYKEFRNLWGTIFGVVLAIFLPTAYWFLDKAGTATEKTSEAAEKADSAVTKLNQEIEKLRAADRTKVKTKRD